MQSSNDVNYEDDKGNLYDFTHFKVSISSYFYSPDLFFFPHFYCSSLQELPRISSRTSLIFMAKRNTWTSL